MKRKEKLLCNSISYQGKVTILYQDNRGKYRVLKKHNTAKDGLFTFITTAAQGIFKADMVPKYLTAVYAGNDEKRNYMYEENDAFFQKVLVSKVPVRLYIDSANQSSGINPEISNVVEYSFVIPSSYIINPTSEHLKGTNIKYFRLLNSLDRSDLAICAEIDVSEENISSDQNANLLVYWRLIFNDSANDVVEIDGGSNGD